MKTQLEDIKNNQQTDVNKSGKEEVFLPSSHPTVYANNSIYGLYGKMFVESILRKVNEFMMEIFKYEGFNEEIGFENGRLKGITQPYFIQALEYRLITQGKALIVKYGNIYYAVNATTTKWDKDNKTIEYVIIEPFAPSLNGRSDLEFVEVRNNWSKVSDQHKIQTILNGMEEVWKLMLEEVNVILPKKIYNTNMVQDTLLNRQAIDNIYKSKKPLIGLDMTAIAGQFEDNENVFIDFVFQTITEPLIKKMDYYIKELYEILGIPVNGSNDKKANLNNPEVGMKNLVGGGLLLHKLEMRKEALKLCSINWEEWSNVKVSFRHSEEFRVFEEELEPNTKENEGEEK